MTIRSDREHRRHGDGRVGLALLALTLAWSTFARAQAPAADVQNAAAASQPAAADAPAVNLAATAAAATHAPESAPAPALTDDDVKLLSCATCGGSGHLDSVMGLPLFGSSCPTCGGSGTCVPGRKPCYTPDHGDGMLGQFCTNLYQALCCPDPCYRPSWIPQQNAAFFQDYARPWTVTRFRWDHVWSMPTPDKAEFFWAKQNIDATQVLQRSRPDPVTGQLGPLQNIQGAFGRGPKVPPSAYKNYTKAQPLAQTRYPNFGAKSLNYDQMFIYQEVASERASFFIEASYLATDPTYYTADPIRFPAQTNGASMFGDMNIGTKAAWIDTELLLLTFQFRTWFPTGNPGRGLGTGHVTLEPSLLMSLKLTPDTYLQGQLAEWIPVGGTPAYQGSILHYHLALNQVLFHSTPTSALIGTAEFNGYGFQAGSYTDPLLGPYAKASGQYFCSVGPGLRYSMCNWLDFGSAVALPITSTRLYDAMLRVELRVIY